MLWEQSPHPVSGGGSMTLTNVAARMSWAERWNVSHKMPGAEKPGSSRQFREAAGRMNLCSPAKDHSPRQEEVEQKGERLQKGAFERVRSAEEITQATVIKARRVCCIFKSNRDEAKRWTDRGSWWHWESSRLEIRELGKGPEDRGHAFSPETGEVKDPNQELSPG